MLPAPRVAVARFAMLRLLAVCLLGKTRGLAFGVKMSYTTAAPVSWVSTSALFEPG